MILTGKALEDFSYKWFSEKYGNFKTTTFQECASAPEYEVFFDEIKLPNEVENSLIIEWFDSVGIYIDTESEEIYEYVGFYAYVNNENLNEIFKSRQEATEKAIEQANLIYNERTNISNKI